MKPHLAREFFLVRSLVVEMHLVRRAGGIFPNANAYLEE
jgi:hypothetical protein